MHQDHLETGSVPLENSEGEDVCNDQPRVLDFVFLRLVAGGIGGNDYHNDSHLTETSPPNT